MGNRWKKWFAIVMATVLGMPGYGLVAEHIQTKAEDESIVIHVENEERHVQINETISLIDGVSVEGSNENGESYRVVVRDVQEQDSGLSLYEEGMEEFSIPQEAAGKTYRVLYQAQSSSDNETWNDVDGVEKEVLLVVNQEEAQQEVNNEETKEIDEENKEVKETEKEKTEEEKEKQEEEPKAVSITLQGQVKEEAEVGEVFSFVHDNNVIMNIPEEDEKDYRIIVTGVDTPESGSYQYHEGDASFVPQKGDEGLTYVVHYGVDVHKDDESHDNQWEQVEGVSFDKEVIVTDKVIIQGEEEITVLAGEEYNFIHDSGLVVKGAKEEGTTYRLKVKGVKSPEGGSYTYQEGDESFIPQESDEGLVYEVTYVAEKSKDGTTWEEVDKVQFTQKIITAVFRPEPVRGPLATEAILCTGQQFNNFVANWNAGSSIKVKNLVKADVPSDLMTASLRYKYETISDPSSPVKIYMWHDMNAYGQYVDTVYFGTEVPGATIYTNPDASQMFTRNHYNSSNYMDIYKIYDSANPSTPYFFNTSKTTNMSEMFSENKLSSLGIPFDCTNGNGVSPFSLMDTSNVTNLNRMFGWSEKIDLTGIETWNVHKVTNVSALFLSFLGKIPWGIGNWEFDNLQNVSACFSPSTSGRYEINVTKWDLSHCDAQNMFYLYNNLDRLGIGPKLIDKNGKAYLPDSHFMERVYSASNTTNKKFNGTWQNENTGAQYFQRGNIDSAENSNSYSFYQTGKGESVTEFEEAYLANPAGMSGVYVPGKGYNITYHSAYTTPYPKDANGKWDYTFSYKGTETTATLAVNPFIWQYHYFQKWEDQSTSPKELKNPGDTVPLNRSYYFQGIWGANERTITYDLDGGVNIPGQPTKFVAGEYKYIYEPKKSGMIFVGWTWTSANKSMPNPFFINNTNTDYWDGKPSPDKAFPDEDVVLKAHWATPKTITIHGNGGTTSSSVTDFPIEIPDINDIQIFYDCGYDGRGGFYIGFRGNYLCTNSSRHAFYLWERENYVVAGLKDNLGNDIFGDLPPNTSSYSTHLPSGTNDFYIQWKLARKHIYFRYNPTGIGVSGISFIDPAGNIGRYEDVLGMKEYTGKQWDETSPNVTISLKGHEIGATNEYIFSNFEMTPTSPYIGYSFSSFTISSPGSSHTYPTGNLTSYTFTGGFDKDVTIIFNWVRAWRIQYVNLDDTPITTMQTLTEADLPYTFRNTYPPHAPWHGFPVLPIGWTLGKYNQGSPDAEGVYTSTGNLPTLFKGTWDATQFDTVYPILKLYPMYSVDVNKDGIPDLFQNKNTLTVSKEVVKGQYSDLTSLMNKVFPYEITFNDVHGDPIKNLPLTDTNGNNYTTDNSGKVTINLRHQESVSFRGMLVGMIIQVVETDTKGMSAEYAISYNGTSFTSGTDTGNITYQDNTPLTVSFKNTAGGNIVPAGIKDTNTRVYVLLAAVLIALAFSIRMLKRRRHA